MKLKSRRTEKSAAPVATQTTTTGFDLFGGAYAKASSTRVFHLAASLTLAAVAVATLSVAGVAGTDEHNQNTATAQANSQTHKIEQQTETQTQLGHLTRTQLESTLASSRTQIVAAVTGEVDYTRLLTSIYETGENSGVSVTSVKIDVAGENTTTGTPAASTGTTATTSGTASSTSTSASASTTSPTTSTSSSTSTTTPSTTSSGAGSATSGTGSSLTGSTPASATAGSASGQVSLSGTATTFADAMAFAHRIAQMPLITAASTLYSGTPGAVTFTTTATIQPAAASKRAAEFTKELTVTPPADKKTTPAADKKTTTTKKTSTKASKSRTKTSGGSK